MWVQTVTLKVCLTLSVQSYRSVTFMNPYQRTEVWELSQSVQTSQHAGSLGALDSLGERPPWLADSDLPSVSLRGLILCLRRKREISGVSPSSKKDTSAVGSGLMTSLNFSYFPKYPITKDGRMLGEGFRLCILGEHSPVRTVMVCDITVLWKSGKIPLDRYRWNTFRRLVDTGASYGVNGGTRLRAKYKILSGKTWNRDESTLFPLI